MLFKHRPALATICLGCLVLGGPFATISFAQSGTRMVVPSRRANVAPARPSQSMRAVTSNPAALRGYCPVCVVEMKKWVRGNPSFSAKHDGKTYYFPGEEQRQMFLKNPAKYTPALGGDCAVCWTEMKKKMPGSVQFTAIHQDRLYLFPSQDIKMKFMSDPSKYENADLALGGNCPVCRVEMNKEVAGIPAFTATHDGMRYQFPSDQQRQMFVANPGKYAVSKQAAAGSGTKMTGSGTK